MRIAALALLLGACQQGELIVPLPSSNDALAATANADTLYALSTEGATLRFKLPSLEEPRVPVMIAPSTTLSNIAYASTGAGYFVSDNTLTRVLGFENSVVTQLKVKVLDPFFVATSGTVVYVSTEKDGLVAVDETSTNVSVVDTGVTGAIAADDTHVYFASANKLARTSRMNGSRDPMFSVDVGSGLAVKALRFGENTLVVALSDTLNPRERTLYQLTATRLLTKTAAVATESSRIAVDATHIYYCASNKATAGNFARVPLVGGNVQILAELHCPFAVDGSYVYVYGRDGIRRVKKSDIPKPSSD